MACYRPNGSAQSLFYIGKEIRILRDCNKVQMFGNYINKSIWVHRELKSRFTAGNFGTI